jgi:hypothetical protein
MAKGKPPRGEVSSAAQPIAGPEAFSDLQEINHVQSQAATLLCIGHHLRGDGLALLARTQAATPFPQAPPSGNAEAIPAADLQALGFPVLQVSTARFRSPDLQRALGVTFATTPSVEPSPRDVQVASSNLLQAAASFYTNANAQTAATLLEASLRHPQELVRVAAAASYFDVAADPRYAIAVLEHGLRSRDLLTRDVAAYALANIGPAGPGLAALAQPVKKRSTLKRSRTGIIVHGTWASGGSWWQPPNGDFWKYLRGNVDPSLYGASDRFQWSGGYSDAARALAGSDLHDWVQQHNLDGLDLFTHSHGGSVAMLANHACTTVGRMVLLSCPVHWPKYTPDFSKVKEVVSIRVHLDLVILADRGGQRFSDSRIRENVLPIWFDHFATHDPANWQKYNVPKML